MKLVATVFIVAFLVGHAVPTSAQFVKGNQAVRPGAVELPPAPASAGKPCHAGGECHAGSWHMVETPTGLQECTEAYARPSTCRASSYGSVKRSRLWGVKSGGKWLQCQYPDLGSKCVDMFARPPANLPFDAVQ